MFEGLFEDKSRVAEQIKQLKVVQKVSAFKYYCLHLELRESHVAPFSGNDADGEMREKVDRR